MSTRYYLFRLKLKKAYSTLTDFYSEFPLTSGVYDHLAGSKRVKNWKITTFLVIITGGTYMTYAGYREIYWQELNSFFQNAGVNIICGIFMYIFLDISFNSIEKRQGNLETDFSYELLNNKIDIDVKEIKILTIFLRVFTPVSTIIDPPISENLDNNIQFKNEIRTEILEEKERREPNMQHFKERIEDLVRANRNRKKGKAKIQILILDPISSAAKIRHMEVRSSIENQKKQTSIKYYVDTKKYWLEDIEIIKEIINTLSGLIEISTGCEKINKSIFEVKLYDRIPPYSLFKIDRYVSFSFYPGNRTVQDAERWNFIEGIPIERYISRTFDEIWGDTERTCTLNQYMWLNIIHTSKASIDKHNLFHIDVYLPGEFGCPDWYGGLCICIPKSETDKTVHLDIYNYLKQFENSNEEIEVVYRGKPRKAIIGTVTHQAEKIDEKYNVNIDSLLCNKYRKQPDTSGGYAYMLLK